MTDTRVDPYATSTGHDGACMCVPCLNADLNAALVEQGRNPADYPVPSAAQAAWFPRESRPRVTVPHPRTAGSVTDPEGPQTRTVEPAGVDEDPWGDELAEGEPVPVAVAALYAGVWARVSGVDPAGQPVTVSGAVVSGPEQVTMAGAPAWALVVRDYQGNPDRAVLTPARATAYLVDDPAEYAARARHAAAPVFGTPAGVLLLVRHGDEWVKEYEEHPKPARMAELERHADPDNVRLLAVYRDDVPVPADLLTC